MYEVLLELDDLLETLTYWLSFAAVALSVMRGTCSLRTRHAHIFQTPEHDICGKATSYKRTA